MQLNQPMYGMAQSQVIQPYIRMMENPMVQTYQGIPQISYQGHQIQTQPFQPFQ